MRTNDFDSVEMSVYPGAPTAGHAAPASRVILPGETVYLDADTLLKKPIEAEVWQYAWRLIAVPDGSRAALAYSSLSRASFVPDVPGRYLVHLDATTPRGVAQFVTRVCVSEDGRLPVAVARADSTVAALGTPIRLDGNSTLNPLGGPLKFQWRIVSAPAGSIVTLVHATSRTPMFIPDMPGRYVFTLQARNQAGAGAVDRVAVNVATREELARFTAAKACEAAATVRLDRPAMPELRPAARQANAPRTALPVPDTGMKTFALSSGNARSVRPSRRRPTIFGRFRNAIRSAANSTIQSGDPVSTF